MCLRVHVRVCVLACMLLRVRFCVCVLTCTFLPMHIRVCVHVYVFASAYASTTGLHVRQGLCGPVRARGPGRGPGRARVCGRGVDTGFSTT